MTSQLRGNKRSADKLDVTPADRLLKGNSDVWVLGDSIPIWAGKIAVDTGKQTLNLVSSIA